MREEPNNARPVISRASKTNLVFHTSIKNNKQINYEVIVVANHKQRHCTYNSTTHNTQQQQQQQQQQFDNHDAGELSCCCCFRSSNAP